MSFKEVSREFHESFMEEEYSRMFQLDCTMLHECAGFFGKMWNWNQVVDLKQVLWFLTLNVLGRALQCNKMVFSA